MSAESPRHSRSGGPLIVQPQPPSDRSIIDAVSGFINDVTLSSSSSPDPKDTIQWARFETADINEPIPEGENSDVSPLLLVLGYGSGVQVWLISPNGEAQEVLSWRQGTVRVLRILPSPVTGDSFASKRPLMALCDSVSPGPPFCSLSFISIRGGEQVKNIKFKNAILDVLANKRSIVVSFVERFAVFDAGTLEDRMAVTSCYPCPCPLGGSMPTNPLALGDRWLAYADKKLNTNKRSSGGCEGEGVSSYTATVLHAAKSLGKGLRGLGESVAQSLGGGRGGSPPHPDLNHPGVVTIIDIEGMNEQDSQDGDEPYDPIVAHFTAHSDPIIALSMDASGMLLVTADRRGHDFHVFRINPHPCGPSLASVHHLYILHRGDTTAKVQDIALSPDARWAAISTLRGTTHMYPVSPYGGVCGVRTHTQPRVVNRLSRFHRSAGLPIHAAAAPVRSGSPVGDGITQGGWFPNPRLPPYPIPTTVSPLAQMRPTANIPTHTITRNSSGRQRLSSLSEDSNSAPLLARAKFGFPSSPPVGSPKAPATSSLYLMAANGLLLQLILHPRPSKSIPKEKVCDDTPIELDVEAVTQWSLQRPAAAAAAADLLAPVPSTNPLLQSASCRRHMDACASDEDRWLAHVEIVTHAGPHRRLWMGPQFIFKTYTSTGSSSSLSEAEAVEVETSAAPGVARSNPVNVPGGRSALPVLIDDGSASSLEQSPSDGLRRKSLAESGRAPSVSDVRLKEDLAEAMKEDHGSAAVSSPRVSGAGGVARAVDPLGTVVVPAAADPVRLDQHDVDLHTCCNSDEARFRPVVRAPAVSLPPHPELLARSLPAGTRIPVQTVTGCTDSQRDSMPLTSDVVIPARLTDVTPRYESLPAPAPARARSDLPTDGAKRSPTPKLVDSVKCDVESEPVKMKPRRSAERDERPRMAKEPSTKLIDQEVEPEKSRKDISLENVLKEIGTEKVIKENSPEKAIKKNTLEKSLKENTPEKSLKEKTPEKSLKEKTPEIPLKEKSPDKSLKEKTPEIPLKEKSPEISLKEKSPFKPVVDLRPAKPSKEDRDAKSLATAEATETKRSKDKSRTIEIIKDEIKRDSFEREVKRVVQEQPKLAEIPKFKEEITTKEIKAKEMMQTKELKQSKEVIPCKDIKPNKQGKQYKTTENPTEEVQPPKEPTQRKEVKPLKEEIISKENIIELKSKVEKQIKQKTPEPVKEIKEESSYALKIKSSSTIKNNTIIPAKSDSLKLKPCEYDIKAEEQAWDLLLNDAEKSRPVIVQQPLPAERNTEENKTKPKRNRKNKKPLEETASKSEDDSFVEIHAIDHKVQDTAGELVSISSPYEDSEPSRQYYSKRIARSPKSATPERPEDSGKEDTIQKSLDVPLDSKARKLSPSRKQRDTKSDEATNDFGNTSREAEMFKALDALKSGDIHTPFYFGKDSKSKKSKSLSPYPDSSRKLLEKPRSEIDDKDLIYIDSSKDDFPEIQITRGIKNRKKSPQPVDTKQEEVELVVEKPTVKSWSSIAASKNAKKTPDVSEKKEDSKIDLYEVPTSSKEVSLQNKLFELCKRTDIMVAECDKPAELVFVDSHVGQVEDLPPLETNFELNHFNLEAMKDSLREDTKLIETPSPICKIDLDEILSSFKDSKNRAVESTYDLVDMEKVSKTKERGFSVVENAKITTQEINIKMSDDKNEDKELDKSSDDDNISPVVLTDSDKEDKRAAGASSFVQPSSKQSAKSKKSRRKKK